MDTEILANGAKDLLVQSSISITSVKAIPQQIIRDQQVVDLEEALTNVSAVVYGGTLSFDEATGLLSSVYAFDDLDAEDYLLQTNVIVKFATGSIKHTLLFGLDYNHSSANSFATAFFFTPFQLNVFNPVYRTVPILCSIRHIY